MKVIRHDWFAMTSQKSSDPEQVASFLRQMADLSPELLKQVVNMVDDNVSIANLNYSLVKQS
jgi:phage host-nuclease inhibitor protein Gam